MVSNASLAFTVMADPTRRAILQILSDRGEVAVGDLAENFPEVTRAAISSHLRVLRSADMVVEQRRGQFRHYSLGPNRADDVLKFLMSVYQHDVNDLAGPPTDG